MLLDCPDMDDLSEFLDSASIDHANLTTLLKKPKLKQSVTSSTRYSVYVAIKPLHKICLFDRLTSYDTFFVSLYVTIYKATGIDL